MATRTQRLARQIQAQEGIPYTHALRLAREEIEAEHANREQRPASDAEQDGDGRG